ncbi:MAG: hypothetical protein MUF76_05560 [Hydrogenophaga sp.]|jgi:uncharacterized membrane protein|nr:hypothetical protein [Hydrogenophaga sp.]
MLTILELVLATVCVAVALALQPWRMLRGPLMSPALGAIAVLPLLWLLPQHLPHGLSIQFSGASLLVLSLGWPLAILVLAAVAFGVWVLGPAGAAAVLSQWVWVGVVPATLALGLGAVLRRWLPPNPFVYTLGRGFLGTAGVVFLSGALYEMVYRLVGGVGMEQALVARWLMAWADAFLTGMFVAIGVAFAPQYLATWADERYLKPPT